MLRHLPSFLVIFLIPFLAQAQVRLSGQVSDLKGKPLRGVSVYLDNTLDGGTTDSLGHFSFNSSEKGPQYLVATSVGFDQAGIPVTLETSDLSDLKLQLKTSPQSLEGVTVTAGYETGAEKNKSVLTTLDIITTAGTQADVVRAIQTLPGTQQQGTQSGLFVRGGDASEAAVIVDGLTAQDAFFTGPPGVATRSRFSPFQFKGVSFSSGGYSARYGQALSSVLELNSLDFPDKSTINLGLNMAGVYASGSKLWKNTAVEGTASYNNLSPFYGIASTNVKYYDVPEGGSGSARFAWKPNKGGMLKVMVNGTKFRSGAEAGNPDSAGNVFRYGIRNTYLYSNISYRQSLKEKWNLYAAASASGNHDEITAGTSPIDQQNNRTQFRFEAKRYLMARFNVLIGGEWQHYSYKTDLQYPGGNYIQQFTESMTAGFLELDWSPVYWINVRPGFRMEHSNLLNQTNYAPRLAVAIRAGRYGQFNVSGGSFYQLPDINYLLYGLRPDMQQAIHYIASYQWIKGDRTLRLEGYYKDYRSLLREHYNFYNPNPYRRIFDSTTNNAGYGYAQGFELFWRDRKLIKNLDYWISYSFIDTRRLYKNYLAEATPEFISDHNASLIAKYYIPEWTTQINMTYSYATGRPYYNPTNPEFLGDRTPDYHNLSFTVNYLTHIKKWFTVVYAGVDNVTNRKNVFGYQYSADGTQRYPQYPALFRSYFVGVNFSLTEFNRDEL